VQDLGEGLHGEQDPALADGELALAVPGAAGGDAEPVLAREAHHRHHVLGRARSTTKRGIQWWIWPKL
jgi:hypothetical protein